MRRLDDGGMTGARSVDGLSMCDCTGTVSDHVSVPYLICVGRYLCVGLYRNTTLNGENLPDRTYYDTHGRQTDGYVSRGGVRGRGVRALATQRIRKTPPDNYHTRDNTKYFK
jgi:hypothetical protein